MHVRILPTPPSLSLWRLHAKIWLTYSLIHAGVLFFLTLLYIVLFSKQGDGENYSLARCRKKHFPSRVVWGVCKLSLTTPGRPPTTALENVRAFVNMKTVQPFVSSLKLDNIEPTASDVCGNTAKWTVNLGKYQENEKNRDLRNGKRNSRRSWKYKTANFALRNRAWFSYR